MSRREGYAYRLPRCYCRFGDYRVAYVRVGRGPALLLLHGLGGTADFWQPLLPHLAPNWTVLCPDLLGFGASDKPPIAYTIAEHLGAIRAVLAHAGIPDLDAVVGHSCGGVLAMALIGMGVHPTRRLVLAATPYPSPRFPFQGEILRSPFDRLMLGSPSAATRVHESMLRLWPLLSRLPVPAAQRGAWAGYLEHTIPSYLGTAQHCIFGANVDPWLPTVASRPIMLLYGRRDRTIPPSQGDRLAAALSGSRLVPLQDGHMAILTEGRGPLVDWLRRSSPRP